MPKHAPPAKIESGATNYYHQDHLSNRLVTNSSGTVVNQMGHFPFGESWYSTSADKLVFTSYERDSESGNDYAMARYYISRLARFSSPDPLSGTTLDPQSLNRYTYAHNDPVEMVDPSGMEPCHNVDAKLWRKIKQHTYGGGPSADSFNFDPNDPDDEPCIVISEGGGGVGGGISDLPLPCDPSTTICVTVWAPGGGTPPGTDSAGPPLNNDLYMDPSVDPMRHFGPYTIDPAGGGGGSGSGPTNNPRQKFQECLDKYGDDRAKKNLNYDGYLGAEQAASAAQIATSELLALWDNENSLSPNMMIGQKGPAGEVGAIQIRPGAVKDLKRFGQLPSGWNTNLQANLTAGALYYADMSSKYNVPGTQAAAAYNDGIRGYTGGQAQGYQQAFNQRQALMMNLVNCMR